MQIIYNVRHHYAIRFKIEGKLLTFLTKLLLKLKASICPAIKENPLLHCRKFSPFVVVVII